MKTLEAATIKEDDYFANLLGNDIAEIAKDIKEAHKKDSNTGSDTTEVDEIENAFEQVQKADNATQAQMIMYSKMFKINFLKWILMNSKLLQISFRGIQTLLKLLKATVEAKDYNNIRGDMLHKHISPL